MYIDKNLPRYTLKIYVNFTLMKHNKTGLEGNYWKNKNKFVSFYSGE